MTKVRNLKIALALLALTFGFSLSVKAQEDCYYGFRIYVRDGTGKTVENGKLEVTKFDGTPVPGNVTFYIDKEGKYNIVGSMGSTVRGDFLFKISADGLAPYAQKFNFPLCDLQYYELRMQPRGSIAQATFERLLIVHGKVYDEGMKPLGNIKIEAVLNHGRVYQTISNQYGYFELGLPKGVATIRVTDSRIPDVVFENFKIEKNYSVLNVPVCLKCKQGESKN